MVLSVSEWSGTLKMIGSIHHDRCRRGSESELAFQILLRAESELNPVNICNFCFNLTNSAKSFYISET